ncbi:MAG: trypsin-like serine protease [Gammaproteobacteria bacterium]|nr:trypsin-like serine protease [Gammaproteobacteria bacterium]
MNTSEKIELPDSGYFLVQVEDSAAGREFSGHGGIEKTAVPEKIAAESFRKPSMHEQLKRAIVQVWESGASHRYLGTAFFITPDCLLTAAHVVEGRAADILSVSNGRQWTKLKAVQPHAYADAALLWLPESESDIQPVPLAAPLGAVLELGQELHMAGYAQAADDATPDPNPRFEVLVLHVRSGDEERAMTILHTHNTHGLSGGPVLKQGRLVGVTHGRHRETNRSYLIPLYTFRDFLPEQVQERELPEYDPARPLELLLAWSKTRYRSQNRLCGRIEDFIGNYSTAPDNPIPFVGRDECLKKLDKWLDQDEQRLRLLSSRAGLGKSALLLHWLARVIARDNLLQKEVVPCSVIFLPISIRFSTANELDGLRLIHAAVCDAFDTLEFSPQAKPDADDYRDRIYRAWHEEIPKHPGRRWLLAVDALDEAVNGWILKEVLPQKIPSNLHVLVSARHKPGHDNGQAWLEDLKISHANTQGTQTEVFACVAAGRENVLELSTLTQSAMAAAIIQLGRPLDLLADKNDFIAELYRLTDKGDPLLLYLWIAAIWKEQRPDLDAQALKKLKPGFAGFFERWLQDQQSVWQAENLGGSRLEFERLAGQFKYLMQVLALAYAPLKTGSELQPLLHHLQHPWANDETTLRAMLREAKRLLALSGEEEDVSVTLIHPRLRDYFRDELKQPKRQAQITQAFLDWGADTVARLNNGELLPEECPLYLLRHYVAHIQAAGLKDREALDRHYLPLLQRGWPFAWEAYEGGAWLGYLNDLQQVFQVLQTYHQTCEQGVARADMHLAAEVRCALLAASIHTINNNLPVALVVELAREEIWSFARAARVAGQYEWEVDKAKCLAQLAAIAPEKEAKPLRQQAVKAATAIQNESRRAEALNAVAMQLRGEEKRIVLQQGLEAAEAIQDEEDRTEALSAVAAQLQGETVLLQQALQAAVAIQDTGNRVKALSAVAAQLQGETALLQQALQAAVAIQDTESRVRDLDEVEGTIAIMYENSRAKALSAVAAQLREESALLQQALQAATAIKDEYSRAKALSAVAAQLRGESALLQQALQAATAIKDEESRAKALSAVAAQLQGEEKHTVLQQALRTAVTIQYDSHRAQTLSVMATQLRGESTWLQQALQAVMAVRGDHCSEKITTKYRSTALNALATQLQGETILLQQVLQAAETIYAETTYADIKLLSTVAAQLRGEDRHTVLQRILEIVMDATFGDVIAGAALLPEEEKHTILQEILQHDLQVLDAGNWEGKCMSIVFLSKMVTQLQGKEKRIILQRILQYAAEVQDAAIQEAEEGWGSDEDSAQVFNTVVAQLQGESALLQQALQSAAAIRNDINRAEALNAVAAQLRGESFLLQPALQAATLIQDEDDRACALSNVAAQLPEEEKHTVLQQALQAVVAIQNEKDRAHALSKVAIQLQGEKKHTVLQQALQAAAAIGNEEHRGEALSMVMAQLLGEGKHSVLQQTLQTAAAIQNEDDRAYVLSEVAAQLQGEEKHSVLQQALQTAAAIQAEESRAKSLSAVAAQLQGESALLQQALQAAAVIQDEWERTEALSAVAAQLQGESALLQQALQAAVAIGDEDSRAEALSAVAAQLQGESALLQQALQAAVAIGNEYIRAEALSAVAAQLQGESALLQQALQAVVAIGDEYSLVDAEAKAKAKALSAVAAQLQGESALLQQALQAAAAIGDEDSRAEVLSAVAVQMPEKEKHTVLQQALQAAAAIQDERSRAYALSKVATQLQGEGKHAVLQQALQAAVAIIGDEYSRVEALSAVAAQLPEEEKRTVLQQALQTILSLGYHSRHTEVLSVVAAQLLQQAPQAAAEIDKKENYAEALSAVATQLRGEEKHSVLQQALQNVAAIKNEEYRAHTLSKMAAPLQGESALLQQALQVVAAIQDEWERAYALSAVAAQLQGNSELQKNCLDMALALSYMQVDRITITAELARQNPAFLTYKLWSNWLIHTPHYRANLLYGMGDLAQAAVQLTGNPKQAEEIARAVVDVGEWWP